MPYQMPDSEQQCVNLIKALFRTVPFPRLYSANTCIDVIYIAAYHATHNSTMEEMQYKLEAVQNGRPDDWLDLVLGVVAVLHDILPNLGFTEADDTTLVNVALHLKYDGFVYGLPIRDFDMWRESRA